MKHVMLCLSTFICWISIHSSFHMLESDNCVTRQQSYYADFMLMCHDSLSLVCCTGISCTLLLLHFIAVNHYTRNFFKVLWSRNRLCLAELLSNLSFKEATAVFLHEVWEKYQKCSLTVFLFSHQRCELLPWIFLRKISFVDQDAKVF